MVSREKKAYSNPIRVPRILIPRTLAAVFLLVSLLGEKVDAVCDLLPWLSSPDLPSCPASGSGRILPDTYPAAAVVIPWGKTADAQQFAVHLIEETIRASPGRIPILVLPGLTLSEAQDGEYHQLIKSLVLKLRPEPAFQSLSSLALEALISKHLGPIPTNTDTIESKALTYSWPQDFFKSTYDPHSGLPILYSQKGKPEPKYQATKEMVKRILEKVHEKCSDLFERSDDKMPRDFGQTQDFTLSIQEGGGNFQGLPGGLYITGDNQKSQENKAVFGNVSDRVEIPVSWLALGHVDEVINVVRDKTKEAPCDFAISIASPRLGLELLNKPENRSRSFFQKLPPSANGNDSVNWTKTREAQFICKIVKTNLQNYQKKRFSRSSILRH